MLFEATASPTSGRRERIDPSRHLLESLARHLTDRNRLGEQRAPAARIGDDAGESHGGSSFESTADELAEGCTMAPPRHGPPGPTYTTRWDAPQIPGRPGAVTARLLRSAKPLHGEGRASETRRTAGRTARQPGRSLRRHSP
jgi:hypothetical protein